MAEPEWVRALFTRSDGDFRFARWGRAIAPVIVGTDDAGCKIFETSVTTIAEIAGHPVAEIDPELGANFLVFLVNEWTQLNATSTLGRLIPDLQSLISRLEDAEANQYRLFAFQDDGGICACITLLRYDEDLRRIPAQSLAVGQVLQSMLLWSDTAFDDESPIGLTEDGLCLLKPDYAELLIAAYHPAIPLASSEDHLALRLAARMTVADARNEH